MNNTITAELPADFAMQSANTLDSDVYKYFAHLVHPSTVNIAVDFYNQIKDSPAEVVKQHISVVEPHGFLDTISYLFNSERVGKYYAADRVLHEISERNDKKAGLILKKLSTLDDELFCGLELVFQKAAVRVEQEVYKSMQTKSTELLEMHKNVYQNAETNNNTSYFIRLAKIAAVSRILLEREYASIQASLD
jgi:hypothetical protein